MRWYQNTIELTGRVVPASRDRWKRVNSVKLVGENGFVYDVMNTDEGRGLFKFLYKDVFVTSQVKKGKGGKFYMWVDRFYPLPEVKIRPVEAS